MPRAARTATVCLSLLMLGLFFLLPGGSDGRTERVPPAGEPELASVLHLQWVRDVPAPKPAWPAQPSMPFDPAPNPAVLGHTVFVPSTVTDGVTAYDTDSGAEKWRFTTDGP